MLDIVNHRARIGSFHSGAKLRPLANKRILSCCKPLKSTVMIALLLVLPWIALSAGLTASSCTTPGQPWTGSNYSPSPVQAALQAALHLDPSSCLSPGGQQPVNPTPLQAALQAALQPFPSSSLCPGGRQLASPAPFQAALQTGPSSCLHPGGRKPAIRLPASQQPFVLSHSVSSKTKNKQAHIMYGNRGSKGLRFSHWNLGSAHLQN